MSGYTLNGVAGRIRDLETKTNGSYYVALCWLAMNRNSGKSARKLLEGRIFGNGKPTSTFRNAWRIAEKSFSEGFHAGCRASVAELDLDEAIKFAVGRLDAHKAALGVASMKEYEDVCKYASAEAIPAFASEVIEDAADAPAAADNENVDIVANIKTAIAQLTLEQAIDVAEWLADHINAVSTVLTQREAQAA